MTASLGSSNSSGTGSAKATAGKGRLWTEDELLQARVDGTAIELVVADLDKPELSGSVDAPASAAPGFNDLRASWSAADGLSRGAAARGEEQPTEAEWVAFQATMPPILRVRVRS